MPQRASARRRRIRPQGWTVGVDWFRWKATGADAYMDLLRSAEELQAEDRDTGLDVKPWSFQGAEGKRSPRVRWARRHDVVYVETSGEVCDSTWSRLRLSDGALTRLDLAATWRLSSPEPRFEMQFLPPEVTTPSRRLPNGKPLGLHYLPDGGFLGTVGQRTAPEYWRWYDKGVELRTDLAGNLWRLELEAKYDESRALGAQCLESLKSPKWCASYLMQRWLSQDCSWPFIVDAASYEAVERPAKPEHPSEGDLRWMERSVRPVVQRLLRGGRLDELIEVLGLGQVVERRRRDDDG